VQLISKEDIFSLKVKLIFKDNFFWEHGAWSMGLRAKSEELRAKSGERRAKGGGRRRDEIFYYI